MGNYPAFCNVFNRSSVDALAIPPPPEGRCHRFQQSWKAVVEECILLLLLQPVSLDFPSVVGDGLIAADWDWVCSKNRNGI